MSVLTVVDMMNAKNSWLSRSSLKDPTKLNVPPLAPDKHKKNILITSALPYVNDIPHLGNIIGCVLSADVFARYCRLRGWNTLFISGTDEYGITTETKALEENLTPKQICDKYFEIHNEIYKWFNISFDQFGRTTSSKQTEIVQEIFKDVYKNGYTTTASMEQLLCENCDRFLANRFVEGICYLCSNEIARGDHCDGCGYLIDATKLIKPRCLVCQHFLVIRNSQQLFLDLPKMESKLNDWIDKFGDNWSRNAKVITKSWMKYGLKERCITRDLKWGIPVPLEEFKSKVFYVGFDAPIGYMSITSAYTTEWRKWWQPENDTKIKYYQFVSKDNVPFHSIMFPACLFATERNYTIVNHIMATENLNYEDGQFSKSYGIGVFGNDAQNTGLPADVFRFYLLFIRPESQDSSFNWADLATKHNSELLNNLGNFCYRALSFLEKYFNSTIPKIKLHRYELILLAIVTRDLKEYICMLNKAKLRDGLRLILSISRQCNQYLQFQKPWVLIKGSKKDKIKAGSVIGLSCNLICLLAVMLQPYMPQTVNIIGEQLNINISHFVLQNCVPVFLQHRHKIGKPTPLFEKIDQSIVNELKTRFAGKQISVEKELTVAPGLSLDQITNIELMAEAIFKQEVKVEKMKEAKVENSELQPEIDLLLQLKSNLSIAKGLPIDDGQKKNQI